MEGKKARLAPDLRRLLIFGSFATAFVALCAVWYARNRDDMVLVLCMFTPAVSVLLTRLVTGEGWKDMFLAPHLRGHLRWYGFAWFATPLLAYAGTALFFILFPAQFDPLGSAYAVQLGVQTLPQYAAQLAVMLPLAVLVNPWFGLLSCLGEEFAWRGYLLPKLSRWLSPLGVVLLTGGLWGIWHAPFIAMGYNYGPGHPLAGMLAMIVFCMAVGCIQGLVFFRVKSVWPAALLHAALNALDLCAPSALFMSGPSNPFVGPDPIGLVGGAGLLAAALVSAASLANSGKSWTENEFSEEKP